MILKPKRLREGDVIGVVAPASPIYPEDRLDKAKAYLQSLGYKVKFGKHVRKTHGYLAGLDQERANDINEMFADDSVKAIFCLRGGYGSPRLLRLIDYALIRRKPKIFVGFSDITALCCAIFAKTGLVTFSGPMLVSDMVSPDEYSQYHLWRMLTKPRVYGRFINHETHRLVGIRSGEAKGRLIGGNLSLLSALVGTPFLPNMRKALLFIEEIGEEPYRIDRMFSQLDNAGILEKLSGLVIGQMTDCIEDDDDKPSLTLEEVIEDYLCVFPKSAPACANLSYGHVKHKLTIPIGAKAKLSVKNGRARLEVLETVVR
ncbi:MAG: LD-carboxypeptidase [Chloroherpetonaceae bacterium]|nr:LD-carboxypeptidase [Chloroherpetonaceae bacterium]MDW8436564.1 LD-carboxypeptidase [Chloroherpetonaceae bacterium]